MSDNVVSFEDVAIKAKVEELWEKVMLHTNALISDTKAFGFDFVTVIPEPDVYQMLKDLVEVRRVLDLVHDHALSLMSYDQIRKIINARDNISRMEKVALALEAKDRTVYDDAVKQLSQTVSF